jgi:hypothetical protein
VFWDDWLLVEGLLEFLRVLRRIECKEGKESWESFLIGSIQYNLFHNNWIHPTNVNFKKRFYPWKQLRFLHSNFSKLMDTFTRSSLEATNHQIHAQKVGWVIEAWNIELQKSNRQHNLSNVLESKIVFLLIANWKFQV